MDNKKDDKFNATRRLNIDELNKKSQNKKISGSSETQVIGKVKPKANNEKTKKGDKNKKNNSKNKKKKFKERHPAIATIIRIILILIILFIIIVAGIFCGALWGGYNFFDLLGDDYKINMDDLVIQYENSIVYDADGNVIANLSSGTKRKCVSMEDMSKYLPKAYLAIEDERFYDHCGVDFKRTGAATLTYITHGGSSSFGGSTITQQVVKNLTNDKEDTAMRKMKEMVKALQVEHYLSKDQILELYLNLIFVGGKDVNGVALGAVYYFNKDVKDLSLAECAYMAAINNTPNSYNPFTEDEKQQKRIENGHKRAKTVLAKMKELGYIDSKEYDSAIKEIDEGLKFENGDTSVTTLVSYHTDAALSQILDQMVEETDMSKELAEIKLYSGGYHIYTTQKTNIQGRLEQELSNTDKYLIQSANGQNSMATMTIIDPKTGNIVATSAGIGEEKTHTYLGYFNYPTELRKQTGSSIKPLAVISAGLESGKITAASTFFDGATSFPGSSKVYKNEGAYQGRYMTLREAIERSQNIPNLKAISVIGVDYSAQFCQSIGLDDVSGNEGVALALGGLTNGVSTLQMAAAYGMVSNGGVYIEPTFYTRVEDGDGNLIIEAKSVEERSTRVMSEANAYIVKNVMTNPVNGPAGTAPYAKINGMDVAAKTGTTNNNYDRWLCEFTNYYAAACWYGYEKSEEVHYKGTNPAGQICSNVMRDIHEGLEFSTFEAPSNVVRVEVCKYSGMRATEKCPETYTEVFVSGTEPAECDKHTLMKICNETGLRASEFCLDYTESYRYEMPDSEAAGNWTTDYGDYPYPKAPEGICPHTVDSYQYED